MITSEPTVPLARRVLDRFLAALGAVVLTVTFFLVLPLLQAIGKPPRTDTVLRQVEAVEPPPPDVVEEEPPPEEEPEEPPPELTENAQPLDLSQLELALNPGGVSDGLLGGDFAIDLSKVMGGRGGSADELFSMADLDQKPRAIHQVSPVRNATVRKRSPGMAKIIYIIDEDGRVKNPKVQSSSDPVFESPALAAIKQWKYEPGKRGGKPVATRARITITFPED